MTLNQFHINAILAGLRLLERTDFADLPGDVQEIYGGSLLPLTRDDIDTLCQNISTVPKGWVIRAVCPSTGTYYADDGTLMCANGTCSIFDDVDE